MKLIIAGSRDFTDYAHLKHILLNNYDIAEISEIVSGTARGADRLGEKFAKEHSIPLRQFPADWDKHGKSAGYIRNKQMADYADALVVFWDGRSKGTKHMINLANLAGLNVKIFLYGFEASLQKKLF